MKKKLFTLNALVGLAILFALAGGAWAADCGGATACSCGDNLVDSRTLVAGVDPIVGAVCTGVGLNMNTSFVTLDLNKRTIQGDGAGTGSFNSGIRIGQDIESIEVLNGRIRRFWRGIDGTNAKIDDSLFEDLRLSDNAEDGIKIEGKDNELSNIRADKNGRHGINVADGTGNDVHDNRAKKNTQVGIKVHGSGNDITDNAGKKNGTKDILVDGGGNFDGGGNKGATCTIDGNPC